MKKYLILVLCLILSLVLTHAVTIEAPNTININEKEEFFIVEIINNSNELVNLEINYFSPVITQVSAPKYLTPNSKTTAKIFVKNEFLMPINVSTTFEVKADNYVSKEILLKFNQETQENIIDSNSQGVGFFSLGLINTTFFPSEYILLFLLILVIIVLTIVFVVRATKRV